MVNKSHACGFPKNWFVNVDSDFLCKLCSNVLDDSQQCKQGHLFCKLCIANHIKSHKKCPSCSSKLLVTDLSSNVLAKNQIAKLQTFCPCKDDGVTNFNAVCTWTGTLDEHTKRFCEYKCYSCMNRGCEVKLPKIQLQQHMNECSMRTIVCERCNANIALSLITNHESLCPQRPVECGCGQMVPFSSLSKHKKEVCPISTIECPLFRVDCCVESCTGEIVRNDLIEHIRTVSGTENTDFILKLVSKINHRRHSISSDVDMATVSQHTEPTIHSRSNSMDIVNVDDDIAINTSSSAAKPKQRTVTYHPSDYQPPPSVQLEVENMDLSSACRKRTRSSTGSLPAPRVIAPINMATDNTVQNDASPVVAQRKKVPRVSKPKTNSTAVEEIEYIIRTFEYDKQGIYEGTYDDSTNKGEGEMKYFNEDVYTGEWGHNERHGVGKHVSKNGNTYEGHWERNKQHGHGVFTKVTDGRIYEGNFRKNQYHGQGKLVNTAKNTVYEGEFYMGVIQGKGIMTYRDGSSYSGEWVNGSRDGLGTLEGPEGNVIYSGMWIKDVEEHNSPLAMTRLEDEEKVLTRKIESKIKAIEKLTLIVQQHSEHHVVAAEGIASTSTLMPLVNEDVVNIKVERVSDTSYVV